MSAFRMALREILNHSQFSAFFALNLAIGLAGFATLDAFERSVESELLSRSRSFLGADLAVSASRPFSDDEVAAFDALAGDGAAFSAGAQLFSMAGVGDRARLVEVRAIDRSFPLRGAIVLDGGGAVSPEEGARLDADQGTWVDPSVLGQLGIEIGDSMRVGAIPFVVLDTVARDSGRATSGFSIAPRLYISLAHLPETQLIATGSRVQYSRLYRLPEGSSASETAGRMRASVDDPRIRVQSHDEATQSLARVYGHVASFLGLVSIIAIFLAGLGAAYLFRAFLSRRLRDIAILMSLGATRGRAQVIFLTQLWLLASLAAVGACAIAALLLPAAADLASDFLPPGAAPQVGVPTFVSAFALAVVGSSVACLPLIVRIRSLRPAELFREDAEPALEHGTRDFLLLLPALGLFWGLSVWRAGDLLAGNLFTAIFGGALGVLAFCGRAGLRALARIPERSALAPRLAFRRLARGGGSALAGFVAISLCALMVSLAPQLRVVLEGDLDPPAAGQIPALFLFDIQPEQVRPLEVHTSALGHELQRISPMVRAKLESINGRSVRGELTDRERRAAYSPNRSSEEEARRLRTRRYNLTYAPALTVSETLVEGQPFRGAHTAESVGLPELSLEVHFADELGIRVGDSLAFDVQGVPVEGRVTNLREVRWNSFQPNFFVTFQPGVLEDAPQIFLASVPRMPDEEREILQASIVEVFPNISIIDVTRSVKRLLGLLSQLQWALASTASLSLVVGLVLVFSIARDQARSQRWETNLLKVLGAEFGQIRAAVDIEFGVLGLLATLAGVACSTAASAILADVLLETPWVPAWRPVLFSVLVIPSICVATARIATRSVLRERPLALLQSQNL